MIVYVIIFLDVWFFNDIVIINLVCDNCIICLKVLKLCFSKDSVYF